jgi:hypothetical protein
VQLRHTAYDLESAARRIRGTSYPQAREFADHNVLHPPPEREMLQAFSRSDAKGNQTNGVSKIPDAP